MTEKLDTGAKLKAPKSSYKCLDELLQKNRISITKLDISQVKDKFMCELVIEEERFTTYGTSKNGARDTAAEEALLVLETKLCTDKVSDKTAVSIVNEICQRNKLGNTFEEMDKDGELFVCSLTLSHLDGGKADEEKHTGRGKSKKDAKHNAAANALTNSDMLQPFMEAEIHIGKPYECKEKQTGYVMIVDFSRDYAEIDEENITEFFKDILKFRCLLLRDPTKAELEEKLKLTSHELNEQHAKYYCFILFLMGHGSEFGVNTAEKGEKKKTISTEEILHYFKNDNMPNFVGKPKSFFIQCCRGSAQQNTVVQADEDKDVDLVKVRFPSDGDILVVYATTEGYKAYRMRGIGSIFIFNTIRIFKESYTKIHIEDMLIDIKAAVGLGDKWRKKGDYAQMPCTWSTLTRRFYLYKTES